MSVNIRYELPGVRSGYCYGLTCPFENRAHAQIDAVERVTAVVEHILRYAARCLAARSCTLDLDRGVFDFGPFPRYGLAESAVRSRNTASELRRDDSHVQDDFSDKENGSGATLEEPNDSKETSNGCHLDLHREI